MCRLKKNIYYNYDIIFPDEVNIIFRREIELCKLNSLVKSDEVSKFILLT